MEPMSIRELVAWVLVLGLVVTLVSLKMKERPTSSKSSRKKVSKPVDPIENTPKTLLEESDDLDTSLWDEPDFIETPPSRDYKKGGTADSEMASVPSEPSAEGSERGGADTVPGSSDRPAKVRNKSSNKRHGSTPHKGKKRSA